MSKKRIAEIAALILLTLVILYLAKPKNEKIDSDSSFSETNSVGVPTIEYGIEIDSMIIYQDIVKKNQFLSDILLKYKVDYGVIDLLAKRSRDIFNVRKIRAGNPYSIFCKNDSTEKVRYFIYENTPTEYIVFDLGDSIHIHRGEKEVSVHIKTASGIISSSLWNAMVEQKTDPNLANELSEIYAWTIDFFGIQKGDYFKVIYEELNIEDKPIGVGKVHASLFHHAGFDYYAYYFVQDSIGDYFDEQAQSLRRTFLKAPLRFKRISSHFSNSRVHPITKIRQPHHGVDYAAAIGTPVQTIGDGVVTYAERKGANGNMVKVKHNGTYTTAYLHLSKFGKGIKPGAHVKQGEVIGYVGSTGSSTGPHLDFRFYKNGEAIDPLKVKSPPAEPVDSLYLNEYHILVDSLQKELQGLKIGD